MDKNNDVSVIRDNFITIITVVLNAEKTIRRTIESVLFQSYPFVEYIIVDGKSTDRTLEYIRDYEERFLKKGFIYRVISEQDNGLYFAMNKGIYMAEGEWTLFLNSDDYFVNRKVLDVVFSQDHYEADCLYGNTINYRDGIYYQKKAASDIKKIEYCVPLTHQALFVRTKVLKRYYFNEKYKFAADYEQWLRMYIDGIKYVYINENISVFSMEGFSQLNEKKYNSEWYSIISKNGYGKKHRGNILYRLYIVPFLKSQRLFLYIYLMIHRIKVEDGLLWMED